MGQQTIFPESRFIILGVPRSGTNMLCTLLNSHPEILCHHELYNPHGIFYALHLRDTDFSLGDLDARNSDPQGFLNKVWAGSLGHHAVGFKFTNRDDEEIYWQVVRDPGVRKIILRRSNRVKIYVSTLIAEATGQWEVYKRSQLVKEKPRVVVEPEKLYQAVKRYHRYYERVEQVLEATHQESLKVNYEDLSERETHQELLEYIGVNSVDQPLQVESVKQNPTDLRSMVANFDELKQVLKGTDLGDELQSFSR